MSMVGTPAIQQNPELGDLKEIFVGNFQCTYKRPRNPWDLKNYRQKASETLRGYIWRFSR